MINLDRIKKDMAEMLKIDKTIHSVEVRADSIDEALADAAVQFDTKVSNLEYEVIEKGFKGIAGLVKKPWTLRIYQNPSTIVSFKNDMFSEASGSESSTEEVQNVSKDGIYYIHRFGSDIVLKVVLPQNGGLDVNANEIINDLKRPDTKEFDESKVKKLAKSGTDGKYEVIGSYEHNPACDAIFVIDVSKDEMQATTTINPPSMGGADVTAEQIVKSIQTQGVLVGISDEKISDIVDAPSYNVPLVVAEAVVPVNGKDAYIEYNFETDRSKLKAKENRNGQIDFKELNQIQNKVEGEVLARKIPAEKGKAGKTLMGNYLEATDGKDIPLPLGKNVKVGDDGLSILAAMNGQVMLVNDKVTIEPVMEVAGVNLKTGGNIKFLGTVIVKGNVEDGFSVEASGNIEVSGNVGSCYLHSDKDIIVSQGIIGRDEGKIECNSLWAKFVESTNILVEENVIVQESIMNSIVEAQKKIILTGKKAQIAGGHLRATEVIVAKNIGAGSAETVLEVGIDPRAKRRLEELQELQGASVRRLDDIETEVNGLEQQKKIRKALPKEKEEILQKLLVEKKEITEKSLVFNEEIAKIQARFKELKNIGRVYASGTVNSGVKIFVREEKEEVRSEVKNVMYIYDLETRLVKRMKYEQPNLEDVKGPDGYSAD